VEHLIVETRDGPVYLVGRLHADLKRPALVVMSGIWAPPDLYHEIVGWFPGATVLVAPLPGMGGSKTRGFEAARMSRMLDEAIDRLLEGVSVVVFGASTGCLVTLGLGSSNIVHQVALEPFFRTAPLWPLHDFARRSLAAQPDRLGAAIAADVLFGVTQDGVVDRDYRYLLKDLNVPTDAIVADLPLEPERELAAWPSLTSQEDRESLARHPLVTLHPGPPASGHDLSTAPEGTVLLRRILHRHLKAAAQNPRIA
jgi:hypothetical protein